MALSVLDKRDSNILETSPLITEKHHVICKICFDNVTK